MKYSISFDHESNKFCLRSITLVCTKDVHYGKPLLSVKTMIKQKRNQITLINDSNTRIEDLSKKKQKPLRFSFFNLNVYFVTYQSPESYNIW